MRQAVTANQDEMLAHAGALGLGLLYWGSMNREVYELLLRLVNVGAAAARQVGQPLHRLRGGHRDRPGVLRSVRGAAETQATATR